jgi:hypothetical protein
VNRPACLLLNYRRSIPSPAARTDAVDFEPNEVSAPELAVYGLIEHRKIGFSASGWREQPADHLGALAPAALLDHFELHVGAVRF